MEGGEIIADSDLTPTCEQSRLEPGETPNQFIDRLRRYLHKWRIMAGFVSDVEGLEN